ncbi:MAG: hypothetical protein MUF62_11220 [Chitinophagaceae bacterium]|jgi:hypothetical protein|nr:hypothetical protein [Chitinophagaceae bacterium]
MQPATPPPSDEFDFVITLKSNSHRAINITSQVLLVIFLISYFQFLFRVGMFGSNLWLTLIPVFIIGLWLYGWVRSSRPGFQVHYRLELMMSAMGWIFLPIFPGHLLMGIAYVLMAILERWVKKPDEFGFSKAIIVRNSFPQKKYEWFEVDNVMIRDNLFTLDLRNNRVIQKELNEPIAPELEAEFNSFCKEQLHFRL